MYETYRENEYSETTGEYSWWDSTEQQQENLIKS